MTKTRSHTGIDADGIFESKADHFIKCPGCGQWFDMHELGQALAHVHDADADIEIGEDPPSPRERTMQ